jgi:hypothetical protein
MVRKKVVPIAKPTIAEVLEQFLAEQGKHLAAGTLAKYEKIVGLLEHCLNNYAYNSLDKAEEEIFDRLYNAKGAEHREFCEVFGPEHILPNVGEFLDYFMIRKVMASKETLRAAGTVTKKLAKWLAEEDYVETEDAEMAAERGGDAARELPEAAELAADLADFAEGQEGEDEGDVIEGHFTLTRVDPGKVWLEEMLDGRKIGPIEVPEEISGRCRPGWTISGIVGRRGQTWRLVEAWNVYPR